jgi:hypothetical protein
MCDKNPTHIYIVEKLKMAIANPTNTTTEKKQLEKAKLVYEQNCATCKRGSNDKECLELALDELLRQMPDKKGDVYPWRNYEWSYSNYVNNNYSASATGSSERNGLFRNMGIFMRLVGGFISDPNPADNSIAGGRSVTDRSSDFPVFECRGKEARCVARHQVIRNSPSGDSPPYNDPFFNKSTTGTRSSSYFVKVGKCARPDITDAETCTGRGYDWDKSKGACSQGRYAYMDNSPSSIPLLRGLVPSIASDSLAITPGAIGLAFSGNDSYGMKVQECPAVTEEGFRVSGRSGRMSVSIFAWGFVAGLILHELYVCRCKR